MGNHLFKSGKFRGSTKRTITDTKLVWESGQLIDLDFESLKSMGFTEVTFNISIGIREIDDGWQLLYAQYLNSSSDDWQDIKPREEQAGSGQYRWASWVTEHGPGVKNTNWGTYTRSYTVSIDLFSSSTSFRLGYWADGQNDDGWEQRNIYATISVE